MEGPGAPWAVTRQELVEATILGVPVAYWPGTAAHGSDGGGRTATNVATPPADSRAALEWRALLMSAQRGSGSPAKGAALLARGRENRPAHLEGAAAPHTHVGDTAGAALPLPPLLAASRMAGRLDCGADAALLAMHKRLAALQVGRGACVPPGAVRAMHGRMHAPAGPH